MCAVHRSLTTSTATASVEAAVWKQEVSVLNMGQHILGHLEGLTRIERRKRKQLLR